MEDLRALFQQKLGETREQVARFQQLERELREGLAYLETCRECSTPSSTTACRDCSQDHGTKIEPALVAGFTSAPGRARPSRPGFVRIEDIG